LAKAGRTSRRPRCDGNIRKNQKALRVLTLLRRYSAQVAKLDWPHCGKLSVGVELSLAIDHSSPLDGETQPF
jgi:hypothetical protein